MSGFCERLDAFFDGELGPGEADAFRLHLGSCETCGHALHERTLLEVLEDAHRPALRRAAGTPPGAKRSMSIARRVGPAIASFAVAAGVLGVALRSASFPPRAHGPELLALETEPSRGVEVRFTYAPADTYRPYRVQRGTAAAHDDVPMTTLAALESAKEYRGVAAALVLSGDARRASEYLDKAGPSSDVAADRAALAIQAGHPDEAIDLLDPILVKQPNHPQALWNQALALEALHLPLVAVQTWSSVAALGEPGWSDEARKRAQELRATYDVHQKQWQGLLETCRALVVRGELPPAEIIGSDPTSIRSCFYSAMVAAPTDPQLRALRPVAVSLEGGDSQGPLVRELDRLASQGAAPRRAYRDQFIELYLNAVRADDATIAKYLGELRAKGEGDLFFEAVNRSRRWRDYAPDLRRIADERGDPWMGLVAERAAAKMDEAKGRYADAERRLRTAVDRCDALHYGSLCAKLEYQRVLNLSRAFRVREAEHAAVAALPRAEAYADDMNTTLRSVLAANAAKRADFALARAYGFDAMLREPKLCAFRADAYTLSAEGYLAALDFTSAKRELEQGARCDGPFSLDRAKELALLSRVGIRLPETADMRASMDDARAGWTAGQRLLADAISGNYLLETDPAAGSDLLRTTAKQARPLALNSDARAALDWSTLSLGWQAAERGDGPAAVAFLADESGLADRRCSLTVGVDYERFFSVVSDASGGVSVVADPHSTQYPPAGDRLASADAVSRLRACPEVRVLATAPVHGMPRLLPPDLAWSYRVSGERYEGSRVLPDKRLIVSDVDVPAELALPPLAPFGAVEGASGTATWLRGPGATVGRVLAELATATEVQVHTHGLTDVGESDAPLLVLSPDASGEWALTARDVAALHLDGHPVVVLAACNAGHPTWSLHEHWSLAAAFVRAGARAVVASADAIPDAPAADFFGAFLRRVRAGAKPAEALRDERMAWRKRPGGDWVDTLLLFE